jgi:hypothetical protein
MEALSLVSDQHHDVRARGGTPDLWFHHSHEDGCSVGLSLALIKEVPMPQLCFDVITLISFRW